MDNLFKRPKFRVEKIFQWPTILGIIVVIGILGYLVGVKLWKTYPEILPAQISGLIKGKPKTEEIAQETPKPEEEKEEKKYIEVAQKGEGITHLARRTLKKYLEENPQDFKVTPEHKIYIEDYIAKKTGGGWLKLGENLEFSQDLIKEALGKAANLTPEQLENLTQYSQLVPSLNY